MWYSTAGNGNEGSLNIGTVWTQLYIIVYTALIHVEHYFTIKVVSLETEEVLKNNDIGEIYIRGPSVTKGYYKNEEATAENIDPEGWLRSGDIGCYDKDGDFFLIDRVKDVLKCFKTSNQKADESRSIINPDATVSVMV